MATKSGSKSYSRKKQEAKFWSLLKKVYAAPLGKMLSFVLLAVVLVLVDILITGNTAGPFFFVLGLEVLAVAVFGWVSYFWRRSREDK